MTISLGNNPTGAQLAAPVQSVVLTNGGSGYTAAPAVTLSGGGYTTAATVTATFTSPSVTGFNAPVAPAGGVSIEAYTSPPVVTIAAPTGTRTRAGDRHGEPRDDALAVNGVVQFSGLSIGNAGSGYTLVASAPGLTGGVSTPINVAARVNARGDGRHGDDQRRRHHGRHPTSVTFGGGGYTSPPAGHDHAPAARPAREARRRSPCSPGAWSPASSSPIRAQVIHGCAVGHRSRHPR